MYAIYRHSWCSSEVFEYSQASFYVCKVPRGEFYGLREDQETVGQGVMQIFCVASTYMQKTLSRYFVLFFSRT